MPNYKDKQVEVTIERLGIHGEGVAHLEGYTLFIEGALPGETVRAELIELRKTFGRARLIERQTSSPHRVEPPCPYFGECGGCQLMHLSYPEQLEMKRSRIVDALERIGKFTEGEVPPLAVLPCIPSPLPLAYRNKIQLPYLPGMRLGLYSRGSHELIEIEGCLIHCALGERALKHVEKHLKASPLLPYDKESGKGLLRHILIKTAVATEQVLVILVTHGPIAPDKAPPLLKTLAKQILESMHEIRGVVQNVNTTSCNTILGDTFLPLAGCSAIEEKLSGLTLKVSPASFFQVNPLQAEQLYQKAIAFCALDGSERVLDAYCGVGALSLLLAKAAREVIGIECVPEAICDAKENAERNKISNAHFVCGAAEKEIPALRDIDVALLNPPKAGCTPAVLDALLFQLKPRRIIYISCDPATLARDLRLLCNGGYQIEIVQPFDMFPQTAHVESVVKLNLKMC